MTQLWMAGLGLALAPISQTPPVLTLEEALQVAEKNAFSIRLSRSNVEKQRQQNLEGTASVLPRVQADTTYTRYDKAVTSQQGQETVTFQPIDSTTTSLTVSFPVDITGNIGRGISATRALLKASQAGLAADISTLRLDVRTAYYSVIQASLQIAVQEDTVAAAREQVRIGEIQEREGVLARVDVLRFQTALEQAQFDLIQAQNSLALAKNLLNNTLGRPIETPFSTEIPAAPTTGVSEAAAVELALKSRPELRSLNATFEALSLVRKAEERNGLPSLSVAGVYQRALGSLGAQGDRETTLGQVTLSIPVWDNGQTRARVKAARQDEEQAKIRVEQARLGISLEVRQAITNLVNSKQRLEVADRQVALAQEAYRLAQLRLREGEGITLEVTDAQAQLTAARNGQVAARVQLLTAYAQLQRAVGIDDLSPLAPPTGAQS